MYQSQLSYVKHLQTINKIKNSQPKRLYAVNFKVKQRPKQLQVSKSNSHLLEKLCKIMARPSVNHDQYFNQSTLKIKRSKSMPSKIQLIVPKPSKYFQELKKFQELHNSCKLKFLSTSPREKHLHSRNCSFRKSVDQSIVSSINKISVLKQSNCSKRFVIQGITDTENQFKIPCYKISIGSYQSQFMTLKELSSLNYEINDREINILVTKRGPCGPLFIGTAKVSLQEQGKFMVPIVKTKHFAGKIVIDIKLMNQFSD